MSKADEMFEKLGYSIKENIYENGFETVEYRKIIEDDIFGTIVKIIEIYNPKFYHFPFIRLTKIIKDILREDAFDLSIQELQAINEKVKELRMDKIKEIRKKGEI